MPLHMVAYETSASEAALTAIQAVPDGTVRINGTGVIIPPTLPWIVCAGAMINSAAATLRAELQSPSLRAVLNPDISPIANGLTWPSIPQLLPCWDTPFPVIPNEQLDVFVQNGAAVMNRAFALLADNPVKPTTGKIYTIRFTTSITLVTATWANGAVTFSQNLPAGTYQVVGFRIVSANGVCARIFFVGGAWRPGVPVSALESNNEWPYFRYGNFGVFDQFTHLTPPSIDILGVTDTAQVGYFDLIKTA